MSKFKMMMRETFWAPALLSLFLTVVLGVGLAMATLATVYTLLTLCIAALVFCVVKMVSHL